MVGDFGRQVQGRNVSNLRRASGRHVAAQCGDPAIRGGSDFARHLESPAKGVACKFSIRSSIHSTVELRN